MAAPAKSQPTAIQRAAGECYVQYCDPRRNENQNRQMTETILPTGPHQRERSNMAMAAIEPPARRTFDWRAAGYMAPLGER